jgi:GTP cyclohydrolase I
VDRDRAAGAIEELLAALGHERTGELARTPELAGKAWCEELLDGQGRDAVAILAEGSLDVESAGGAGDVVVLRDLAVTTMCPHHLLPAHGHGDIVYLLGARVAGLGSVAQALRACTRRLTLQERAGAEMARALVAALGARGAACRLRLTHTCLLSRGARETEARLESLALEGACAEPGAERTLALQALAGTSGA